MITELFNDPLLIALLFAWFIHRFEPIEEGLTMLIEASENSKLTVVLKLLYNVITCLTCISFWLALIISFNVVTACIAGVIAEIYSNVIRKGN